MTTGMAFVECPLAKLLVLFSILVCGSFDEGLYVYVIGSGRDNEERYHSS